MKYSEESAWFGSLPREALVMISVQESDWATYVTTVGAIVDAAARRVVRIEEDERTLQITDGGTYLRFEFEGTKFLHVDDEATMGAALPDNAAVEIRNASPGMLQVLISSTDVVIHPPGGGTLFIPEGGTAVLKRIGDDEYDLIGVTEPEST